MSETKMNILKVILPDGKRVWIGACPADCLAIFWEAMKDLMELQEFHGDPVLSFNDSEVIDLVSLLASLLPILPFRQQRFSIEPAINPLNIPWLSQYFYGENSLIAQLHLIEEEPTTSFNELPTPDNFPVKPSGNPTADLLARLSVVDGNSANAMRLIETYDLDTLNNFIQQVGELKRDPKERFDDYKREKLQEIVDKAQNDDYLLYAQIVGLRTPDDNSND